jgi:hypothetical protein
MAIVDERQVTFDSIALRQVVGFSPNTAINIGFPNNEPTNISLNPSAHSVTFEFLGTAVTLQRDKLGALLISYCIRSGIKVPRDGQRSVHIQPTKVILVFRQEFVHAPEPVSIMADRRLLVRRRTDQAAAAASKK